MRLLAFLLSSLIAPSVWAAASTSFDGSGDLVNYGDIPAIDDATNLSCSVWVYNNNVTQDHAIVGTYAFSPDRGFYLFMDDVVGAGPTVNAYNVLVADSGNTLVTQNAGSDSAVATTWQAVAFSFAPNTSSGLSIYIDFVEASGSPFSTTNVDNAGSTNRNVEAGRSSAVADDRAGRLAYLQCWNGTLTKEELDESLRKPGCIRPEILQLFDSMWDGGSTHADLSGNGETGAVTGATASDDGPPVMIGCGGPQ